MSSTHEHFKHSRFGGYECSSQGDKRFSALFARMPDGRTIEMHYQCDIKGYCPGGTNWKLGKSKPPINPSIDLWKEYLGLWEQWAFLNPNLMGELGYAAQAKGYLLSDRFATTPVNQARALATLLNKYWTP